MRPQDTKFLRTLIDRFCLPRPVLAASVWAEQKLVLNEPKIKGPFTFIGREYLREPVDAWGPLPPSLAGGADFSGCFGTGAGKALDISTPIPTPSGWKKMFDLQVGDEIFAPDGKPTKVVFATECMNGHKCFKVIFSDGSHLIADEDHLWETTKTVRMWDGIRKRDYSERIKWVGTTKQIAESLLWKCKRPAHAIPVCEPVQYAKKEFPIPPYSLGVWLGDGHSRVSVITFCHADREILAHLKADGTRVSQDRPDKRSNAIQVTLDGGKQYASRWDKTTFAARLRKLGLIQNKHIPKEYLEGSVAQRWELIQGLMDTDGYVNVGKCEFCSTRHPLAVDFYELALSLGLKASMNESEATLYGRVTSKRWRITFTADNSQPVFKLARKQAKLKNPDSISQNKRQRGFRKIVAVEPCQSFTVRCIQVDHPSHCFLAGHHFIKTHNTISCIAGLCYRFDNDPMRALVVKPTANGAAGAKSFAKTRLQKAIRATPCLAEKIPTGAQRHDFASSQMQLNGSIVDLTGSNSVGQLSENRCDVVLQDEVDKYPTQTESSKEANPITLADERTKSVPESRRYKFSTPTLDNTGIWIEFKKSDQRRYFVPCPHCSKHVVFAWSKQYSVFKQQGFEAYIRWDDNAREADGQWDLEKVAATAHAVCPHCQGKILNSHKFAMIKNGEWRATAKGAPGHIGWHLPSMYSTSRDCDFGQMAKKFLIAKHSLDGVKGFINSDLAEPDVNQAVSVDRVGTIWKLIEITQEWINLLSVDYQQEAPYFWAVVRAWNGSDAAHGLEYRSLMQWYEIDEFQKEFNVPAEAVIIDCGHEQMEVIRNCAELSIPTRATLKPAVGKNLPAVSGWQPCKSFGNRKQFRNIDQEGRVIYQPLRRKLNYDAFSGTDMAKKIGIELLEIKSDLIEDQYENIRNGKTFLKWTISEKMDVEEYHKHISGKVKKAQKNNPRDTKWVQRHPSFPDHLHSCEMLQIAMASRLNLISYEALKTKTIETK